MAAITLKEGDQLSIKQRELLVAIGILLTILIASNTVEYTNRKKEQIRKLETKTEELSNQLEQKNEILNKTQEELEAEKKRADARVKARVASAQKKPTQAKYVAQVANTAGVQQWRPLCEKYFGNKADECLLIMKAESGGNPNAVSPTNDHGLLQLNCGFTGSKGPGGWCTFFGVTKEQIKDPETNVRLAKEVYKRSGNSWRQWTTARKLGL